MQHPDTSLPPHPLDHPIWNALATHHAALRRGGAQARRYDPAIAPFAALAPGEAPAMDALVALLQSGEDAALLWNGAPPPLPPTLDWQPTARVLQMVAQHPAGPPPATVTTTGLDVLPLEAADAPAMLALAQQTRPGPFSLRTREMGHYLGMRSQGRLVAMAGERMRLEGYTEISAVCVDASHRGQGLAGGLMALLRARIEARGDQAFLHVLHDNHTAIGLYERLGYVARAAFDLVRVSGRRPQA